MCSLKHEDTHGVSADPHSHTRLHPTAQHKGQKVAAVVFWVKVEKRVAKHSS